MDAEEGGLGALAAVERPEHPREERDEPEEEQEMGRSENHGGSVPCPPRKRQEGGTKKILKKYSIKD